MKLPSSSRLVAAAALPFLKVSGRGRVINISSQAGIVAIDEHAAYGASKAGLILLTKIQALEWAKFGITSNAIAPTVVETPMALVGWSGEKGVKALNQATPSESGRTAASWTYTVEAKGGTYTLAWTNNVMAGDVPLVILLQYGH